MNRTPVLRIAYFGHNRSDTAFQRRIRALRDAGTDITTFTFRRDGEPLHPGPPWHNVDLGHVEHARLFSRIRLYLRALATVFSHRDVVRRADIVYARNLDIFAFAALGSALALGFPGRDRPAYVYECLDVHEALIGRGRPARILRWVERRALRRARLLIVSSPSFLSHYFEPAQGYRGPSLWVENKLYFGETPKPRRGRAGSPPVVGGTPSPLVIGWVGIIRCQRTLDLLKALAIARPHDVLIRIFGRISYFLIGDFDEQISEIPNMEFRGEYTWPEGLADVYRDLDLV